MGSRTGTIRWKAEKQRKWKGCSHFVSSLPINRSVLEYSSSLFVTNHIRAYYWLAACSFHPITTPTRCLMQKLPWPLQRLGIKHEWPCWRRPAKVYPKPYPRRRHFSRNRRPHFEKPKRSWNEQIHGHGSWQSPKQRMTVLAKTDSNLQLCCLFQVTNSECVTESLARMIGNL